MFFGMWRPRLSRGESETPVANKTTTGDKNVKKAVAKVAQVVTRPARSTAIARRGIETGTQFAGLMSALISDVVDGNIPPSVCNAACNAGGKLLKVVEMNLKYGTQNGDSGGRQLFLTGDPQKSPSRR